MNASITDLICIKLNEPFKVVFNMNFTEEKKN